MSNIAVTGRQAIVRAVYDAVLADGFGQLRVRQLAESAGVSSGLIHHYWPNLDALVVEAFELFAAEFAESIRLAINPRHEPRRQLRDLVATLIPDGEVPEVSVWLEAASQARRQPAIRSPGLRARQHSSERRPARIGNRSPHPRFDRSRGRQPIA